MMTTKAKPAVKRKQAKKTSRKPAGRKAAPRKDIAASYNQHKEFAGQQYTGVQIGRGHHWHYDQGDWKETKITPDLWEISYAVTKRRVGHAPEGSGVPVGTDYNWYILAHQSAEKLNANDYSTTMTGLKFKLAHKRAGKGNWNISGATQRKHLIQFLKEVVAQLEENPIPLSFEHEGQTYKGEGVPVARACTKDVCYALDISLNGENRGIIRCMKSGWKMDLIKDQKLVDKIGRQVMLYYE